MSEVLATVWDDVNCRGVPRLISVGGIASRTSGSAFSVATPLFPNGSGKLIPCDGTETAVRRFSGFSVTASAAPDDTVSVALPGQIATGHAGLTPGALYFLCGTGIVESSALAAWIGAQPADTPYCQIGTAQSATELLVVPGNLQTT